MDDEPDIHDRLEQLEARVADQQATIEQLTEPPAVGRRSVVASLLGAGAVGGLAGWGSQSARAQASGPAGQVGTGEEPVDGFLWDLDVQNGAEFNGNPLTGVGPLEAESLVANNVVVDEDSDLSFHKGDLVDVDGGSTETIFDVTEPVDIVHGTVHGNFASFIRVEFGDGTTKDVYDGRRRARDDEDNIFETAPLPSCKDVVKLEFKNDGGRTLTYGWEVATI